MNVIERTPSTGGRFWPGWLLIVLWLISASALTGCSTSYAVAPRLPAPNPELMEPEKTGSEYSASVSQHMKTWAEKLDGWLTK